MFGLTPLGAFHTAISLIAVAAGLIALIRDKEISPRTLPGKVYVVATIVSCVTGLGIFHHGGFGAPHVLSIITLAVLGVAVGAGHSTVFGRASRYVETVSYSATLFFHFHSRYHRDVDPLPARSAAGGQCRRAGTAGGDRGVVRRVLDRGHPASEAVARREPGVVDLIGPVTPTGSWCRARLKAGGPTGT